eukprot:gene1429-1554_t
MIESRKEKSNESSLKMLEECRKFTAESMQYGNHTLSHLGEQEEKLNAVEDILEDNQNIITESIKRLRRMTWTGYFYDTLSTITTAPGTTTTTTTNSEKQQQPSSVKAITLLASTKDVKPSNHNVNKLDLISTAPNKTTQSEEERALEELSRSVSDLHQMTITIGQALDASGNQISRIENQTEKLTDETLHASLRASKIMFTKGSTNHVEEAGRFQFVLPDGSGMLGVLEDKLVLTPIAGRNCIFSCLMRNGLIIGLRSESSYKFVGCTIWGSIAVSGEYFGSQEELYVDINGNLGGMLFLARNLGAGGWLRADSVDRGPNGEMILGITTTHSNDKANMLTFQSVRCG